jgi:ADP-ribosyl-[dinitrogen reductase] hydrolase
MPTLSDRICGAIIGLATGDALGTTLEFMRPGTFEPITDLIGGGPFRLKPGQWTDDTSMMLCLAESLIETGGFDAKDQLRRYVGWWQEGHHSSTGRCFDIGNTVREALDSFLEHGDPERSGVSHDKSAGNGSLMRLAPVPVFFVRDAGVILGTAAYMSPKQATAESGDVTVLTRLGTPLGEVTAAESCCETR